MTFSTLTLKRIILYEYSLCLFVWDLTEVLTLARFTSYKHFTIMNILLSHEFWMSEFVTFVKKTISERKQSDSNSDQC